MASLSILLSIDMIIRWVRDLAKVHAATRPIGSEAARLYAGKLDAPLRLHLFRDGFGKTLDCPFAGTIDGKVGDTCYPSARELPRT